MTSPVDETTLPSPFFHDASGAVRFWVLVGDGTFVGASISKQTLHFRFGGDINGADALATYAANQEQIDEAARRRIAAGSIEPVMLRETDVAGPR
ncbi:DUF1488 family protein [Piscinibacter sp.]|uniref:DUF1488 family protein n=1 Tax=Piscinibacter sp. TaxID=1903157 RepID=UPI003559D915